MEDIADRPKWLLELENRKRKPRLAHETGAGAPCVNCNSGCPGLDLHFWRKICKNCKCSRDDHDVDDDDFLQFDLLFGSSKKFKKKSMCLKINNKKHHEGETVFEWVPPDTTKELAMDYMKALPTEKLPIKGSTGAILRRQLLQKQLPLHDINYKACDELSEQEQKQFEKYLENIKKYVGQGKVMKILAARPFDRSLMTPINATDMQRCSPQRKPHIPSSSVQLRTPSSFAVKNPHHKHPYKTESKQDIGMTSDSEGYTAEEYKCSLDNISVDNNIARSQPIEGKFCENIEPASDIALASKRDINSKVVNLSIPACLVEQEIVPAREMHTSEDYVPHHKRGASKCALKRPGETLNDIAPCFAHSTAVDSEVTSIAESMLADAFLPPSAIHASDIIGSTLDEEKLSFIRDKLADKYKAAENLQSSRLSNTSDALSFKGKKNPMSGNKGTVVRKLGTSGASSPLETERKTHKYPSQIIASTPININDEKQCGWPSKYKGTNNSSATETPNVATECPTNSLSSNSNPANPAVSTSNSSDLQSSVNASPLRAALNNAVLRPTVIHSEQLQNQVFPHIVGNFNEQRDTQHTEYLKDAMEGLKIDSTKPHTCEKCREDIRVGDVAITAEKANNAFWHPGCFVCSVCNELLVDLVYFYYKNQLYCGRDLAAYLEIPRCFACDELIFVREYTVAEGHNYHVKHFCCWDCDIPLAGQQYITENDRPLCLSCYQKSYAKTCIACNTVIAADQQGVAIKDLNFHATEDCFCCYSCRKNLLNGKMAIKKDKLFCSKECISKFLN